MDLKKAQTVTGHTLVFRNVCVQDAEFILSLRTDDHKARHLSPTSFDIEAQRAWIEKYTQSQDQAYFIIENKHGEALGTVRLYDPQASSFCWGSWILKDNIAPTVAIESALMVYAFAVEHLAFSSSHFEVRRANTKVWQFHERFGAIRVKETDEDFFYAIELAAITKSMARYRKWLPNPVTVNWLDATSTLPSH